MSIVDILTNLCNPDVSIRGPAEQQITEAKENDFANFILAVLRAFREESNPPAARQMALTLLKNAVAPSFREVAARRELEAKWKALPGPVREEVKQEVLHTLGSGNAQVRSAAANLIGSLSRIELPAGEWPNLIDILTDAAANSTPDFQEAALTALGYICEEGKDHDEVEEALRPQTNKMLNAIVQCMSHDNEAVKYSATNALCNAMEYIHDNMSNAAERDYLLSSICTTAKTSQNSRTRERAMEILVKVVEFYYSILPSYISAIHEITTNFIFNDEEAVGLQAMSFWITIAEQELEMKLNGEPSQQYCQQGMSFLIDICLQLVVRQDEDQTEDDWNLSIAATKLILTLAEVLGPAVHQPLMSFVFANVDSPNWRQREAAIGVFGCLVSVDDDESLDALKDTVAQAASENGLLKYLLDPVPLVADTCGWLVTMVCTNYPEVFLQNPPLLQKLLQVVLPMVEKEEGEMFKRSTDIIRKLSLTLSEEDNQPTNELSPHFPNFVQALLHVIDNSTTTSNRARAADSLNDVIASAANDSAEQVLLPLIPNLLNRLQYLLESLQRGGTSEELDGMVSVMCGAISDCAHKLGPYFEQYANQSLTLLLQVLATPVNYIQEEVVIAIGSIAHAVSYQHFAPFLEPVLTYISNCMTAYDEPDQMQAVLAVTGDLCLACKDGMKPYSEALIQLMYSVIQDEQQDREIKLTALQMIGDIALNVLPQGQFTPHLAQVMNHTTQLFYASRAQDFSNDSDTYEYCLSLWHALSELYSNIVQSYNEKSGVEPLGPYFGNYIELIFHIVDHCSDEETILKAVALLGDVADVLRFAPPALRQNGKAALLTDKVQKIVDQCLKSYREKEQQEAIKWASKKLNALQRC